MQRWLAIVILLASCNGCMVFDDLLEDFGPPAPRPTCGAPAPSVQQTAEPPR